MAGAGLCDDLLLCGVDSLPESSPPLPGFLPRADGDSGEATDRRSASEDDEAASSAAFRFPPRGAPDWEGRGAEAVFVVDLGMTGGLSEGLGVGLGSGFVEMDVVVVDEVAEVAGAVEVGEATDAETGFLDGSIVLVADTFSLGRLAGRLSVIPALAAARFAALVMLDIGGSAGTEDVPATETGADKD